MDEQSAPLTGMDYDRFAPFYDLEFDAYLDDLALYRSFAARSDAPLLELGCGSGRALALLAEDGHLITGVDFSAAMLARARDRVARAGLTGQATLVEDDIRSLSRLGDRRFGLAFSAINSFLHLESQDDQLAALVATWRYLRPGGVLILDLFPPYPELLSDYDGRLVYAGALHDPQTGERIDKFATSLHNPAEQRIETTFFYDRLGHEGDVVRTAAHFVLRYIGRYELVLLLERAGYGDINLYGSYDLAPLTAESERMIAIARRP